MAESKYYFSKRAAEALKTIFQNVVGELTNSQHQFTKLTSLQEFKSSKFSNSNCIKLLGQVYEDVASKCQSNIDPSCLTFNAETVNSQGAPTLFRLVQDMAMWKRHSVPGHSQMAEEFTCSEDSLGRAFPSLRVKRADKGITNRFYQLDLFSWILTGSSFDQFMTATLPQRGLIFAEDAFECLNQPILSEESAQSDAQAPVQSPHMRNASESIASIGTELGAAAKEPVQTLVLRKWGLKHRQKILLAAAALILGSLIVWAINDSKPPGEKPIVHETNVNFYGDTESPDINIANGNQPVVNANTTNPFIFGTGFGPVMGEAASAKGNETPWMHNVSYRESTKSAPIVEREISPPRNRENAKHTATPSREQISGVLRDAQGNPVAKAKVALSGCETVVSDVEGHFALSYPVDKKNTTTSISIQTVDGKRVSQLVTLYPNTIEITL
jgi:hypothetical protein